MKFKSKQIVRCAQENIGAVKIANTSAKNVCQRWQMKFKSKQIVRCAQENIGAVKIANTSAMNVFQLLALIA